MQTVLTFAMVAAQLMVILGHHNAQQCFSRNVTASISTENLAHIDAAITAGQLKCQLHNNTTL